MNATTADRIAVATTAFAAATTREEKQAAFDAVCQWVADTLPQNADSQADTAAIEKAARAEILSATGVRTTLRYS